MQIISKVEPQATPIVGDSVPDQGIMNYFGVEPGDLNDVVVKKINDIKAYLATKDQDEFNQHKLLRDFRFRMGASNLGENALHQMHRYLMIRRSIEDQEAEAKAMEL